MIKSLRVLFLPHLGRTFPLIKSLNRWRGERIETIQVRKEGYLSKIVYEVNFINNVSKGFLENKVETLAIYIYMLIMSMYMKKYFERGDYPNYFSREGLTVQLR